MSAAEATQAEPAICELKAVSNGYAVHYYNPQHLETEVSIFTGPCALDRAVAFAGGQYYDGWLDPDALAGY